MFLVWIQPYSSAFRYFVALTLWGQHQLSKKRLRLHLKRFLGAVMVVTVMVEDMQDRGKVMYLQGSVCNWLIYLFFTLHHHFAWLTNLFLAPQPECTSNSECPRSLECMQEECKDPCQTNYCGRNAECEIRDHRAICVCPFGYIGNPYSSCKERKIRNICVQFRMTLYKLFKIV